MNHAIWEPLAELELYFFKNQTYANYCLCSRAFIKEDILKENFQEYKICSEVQNFNQKSDIKYKTCYKIQKTSHFLNISCLMDDNMCYSTLKKSLSRNQFKYFHVPIKYNLIFFHNDLPLIKIKKLNLNLLTEIILKKLLLENRNYIIWKCLLKKLGYYCFYQDFIDKKSYSFQTFYTIINKIYKNSQIECRNMENCNKFYKICNNSCIKYILLVVIIGEKKIHFKINCLHFISLFKVEKKNFSFLIINLTTVKESLRNYFLNNTKSINNFLIGQFRNVKIKKNIILFFQKSLTKKQKSKSQCLYYNIFFGSINLLILLIRIGLPNVDSSKKYKITKYIFSAPSNYRYSDFPSVSMHNTMKILHTKFNICQKNFGYYPDICQEDYVTNFESLGSDFYNELKQNTCYLQENDNYKFKTKSLPDLTVTRNNNFFKTRRYFNSVGYCLQRLGKCNDRSELLKTVDFDKQFKKNFENDSTPSQNYLNNFFKDFVSTNRKGNLKKKTRRKKKKHCKNNKIQHALTLMGYSYKKNNKEKFCGNITFWKLNIQEQNKSLKNFENKPKLHFFFDENEKSNELNTHAFKNLFPLKEKAYTSFKTDIEKSENSFIEFKPSSLINCVSEKKLDKKNEEEKNLIILPQEIMDNKNLLKYWLKRYQLFSKFDEGIKLDQESWFSVTPEALAKHHAERCRCDIMIDAFCGAGGNSIQFSFTCERVIAIDIDPKKIKIAKHNAKIYGVEDRIEFIVGDFTSLACSLFGDVVFLSPPWGGPSYIKENVYSLSNILPPLGGQCLFTLASDITENVAYFLPKNADLIELTLLSDCGKEVEIEQNFLKHKLRSLTAYFGELILYPDKC